MKLLHLHLHDRYRSLPAGFRVEFLQEAERQRCFEFAPFCLAGLNGSGKSNLLEALAAIFYHIEVMHLTFRPDNFTAEENPDGFDSRKGEPDAYELEYYCQDDNLRNTWDNFRWDDTSWDEQPVVHIRLTKKVGTAPVMQWLNRHEFDAENKPLELTSLEAKRYLPRYILGYSSGHNEVLSLPFRKMRCIHFDEYRHYLRKSLHYSKPEGRMLFMDESYSQVILLCHFLFPSSAVQQVFLKKVGLVGIRRFRFVIRRAEKVKSEAGEIELTSRLSGKQDAEGKLQARLLDKLIQCATCHYEDYRYEADENAYDLYLDYLMDEAGEMRKAFRYHFGEGAENASEELVMAKSALNLFEALHVLLTLNGYQTSDEVKKDLYESHSLYSAETLPTPASHDRIFRIKDFELVKKGVNGQLYGKALSDGEHQLLHTIGLCLLFRHEPALFLLDEPETHLNPDWRASYISTLRAALKAGDAPRTMREVLLTSHSPFVVSDCPKENVLVFEKNEAGLVQWHNPDFQTFGASATLITHEIFGRRETIGDYANEELKKIEAKLEAPGQDARSLARELDRTLGDSIEKTLAITRILKNSSKP